MTFHRAHPHRVVIKVGTNVLLDADGYPALGRLFTLMEALVALRREGLEIVLVSSGAIGLGALRLGLATKPKTLDFKQACAAVGQGELMGLYQSGFHRMDTVCAQVLLVEDDFADTVRRGNLRATLEKLLQLGVIPIINENDTVSTLELERVEEAPARRRVFGDNDKLSALVAAEIEADLLLILSDVEGLHEANPKVNPEAPLIPVVKELTPEIWALAQGGSERGRGGMSTKLEAARLGMDAGVAVVIASGEKPGAVRDVAVGRPVGTYFVPCARSAKEVKA